MNKALSWLLILGGGYVVLEILGINPITTVEKILGITPSTTSTTPTVSTASTTTSVSTTNTLALVAAAAQAGGTDPNSLQTVSTWNYYFNAVRGIPGPAGLAINGAQQPVGYLVSITDWWIAMQNAGFSGLGTFCNKLGGGIMGMGVLAHANPYNNPQGTPFRQNLLPTGYEKNIVVMGS